MRSQTGMPVFSLLDDSIYFHIEELQKLTAILKKSSCSTRQTPLVQNQFTLWKKSQLRLTVNSTPASLTAQTLAAPDFIAWHKECEEKINELQNYFNEIKNFITKKGLAINIDEILLSAKDKTKKYFPAYQLIYENKMREASFPQLQEKLLELIETKKKLKQD